MGGKNYKVMTSRIIRLEGDKVKHRILKGSDVIHGRQN